MAIGNLASAIPAGMLTERVGLRRVLLGCFLLVIATCSARTFLLSFQWQITLAFLEGAALSAWAICLSPTVAQLTDESQRPRAFSLIFSLGIGLGAFGGLFGSRLPGLIKAHGLFSGSLQPEQLVLLLSCGIVAVGLWPISRITFFREIVSPRSRAKLSPILLRYLPAVSVWSLVTGSFSPFATVYLSKHLHMSLPQVGNVFSISQMGQVAAVLAAPFLFRRLGVVGGIVSTQLASGLLLVILAAIVHPIAAAVAYVGFTAFQWMNEPGLYSMLMTMVPAEKRGNAAASNSLVMSVSQAIAATLAGTAFMRYGYASSLRGIALIAAIAAALFWRVGSYREVDCGDTEVGEDRVSAASI